ncbi:MAG: hypothetical protein COB02_10270 [Candidatus Cloacimonadota bacterium]|nr:MAG: hypothetical protein COB02_10270 [Candidatus Cloacimonadota bacterium]
MFKKNNTYHSGFSLIEVLMATGMIAVLFGSFFLILSQSRKMTISLREKQRMFWVLKYESTQIQNYFLKNEEFPELDSTYINRLISQHKLPALITKFRLKIKSLKQEDNFTSFVLSANWKQKGSSFEQALKFNFINPNIYKLPTQRDL